MTVTLIPTVALLVTTIAGVVGLRGFSSRIRIIFDSSLFVGISLYFLTQETFPVFPPLNGPPSSADLWSRAIGGAWWLLGARIVVGTLGFVVRRNPRSRATRMYSDLLSAAIYITAAGVVMNSVLALPVTGVVATSGVVAIVLGLALQNTLADVFAGIAVGIEAPFRVGDRIEIEDKIEGQVVQVNWRSTRIQTDGDDVAIIPNSLIAKAQIINRSFPSQRRAASVELACPEAAVPDRVIEVLLQATLLCPDILRNPAPSAVLMQLGSKRNIYRISFFVEGTKYLVSTKDLLLRGARRQLHYAGFLDRTCSNDTSSATGAAVNVRRLLRELVLFEFLSVQQLDDLGKQLDERRLEPGDTLFTEGATDTSIYVIASGILEITRQADAASETIGCIGAGEYIGEIGLLMDAPHAATAVARTHCRIYLLTRNAIAPLLEQNTYMAAALEQSARRGLEILHREVAARATPSLGSKGLLLSRIRSIFQLGSPSADRSGC